MKILVDEGLENVSCLGQEYKSKCDTPHDTANQEIEHPPGPRLGE
jgi:hypothetical protein